MGAIGLGVLVIVVGLALLFVPGIGILGILLMIIGVLLMVGGFAASRRRVGTPASRL